MSNQRLNKYPLGIRFCKRGSLPYLATNNLQCSSSIAIGDSKRPALIKRKYLTDFGLCLLWKFSLVRTPYVLSPLPIYTTSPLIPPSSYIPCTSGTNLSLAKVKGDQRFGIGIIPSFVISFKRVFTKCVIIQLHHIQLQRCASRDLNPNTAYTAVPSKSTVYAFPPLAHYFFPSTIHLRQ